ncbi:MAG: hypothetical protein AB7O38_18880 [Pirellulaceae bacterium]
MPKDTPAKQFRSIKVYDNANWGFRLWAAGACAVPLVAKLRQVASQPKEQTW